LTWPDLVRSTALSNRASSPSRPTISLLRILRIITSSQIGQ